MAGILDDLDGAASILVSAPSMAGDAETCTSLLTGDVTSPSVLFVTFTSGPSECVERLGGRADGVADLAVITVGTEATAPEADVETRAVSSANDLTGLSIAIDEFLSDREGPVTVCFDSVTALLQYVDFETAFEFLHALLGQFHAADVRAHFHVDPAAHDPEFVAAITSLFEAAVDLEDGPAVRTRDL